jgi:hypothetical protein
MLGPPPPEVLAPSPNQPTPFEVVLNPIKAQEGLSFSQPEPTGPQETTVFFERGRYPVKAPGDIIAGGYGYANIPPLKGTVTKEGSTFGIDYRGNVIFISSTQPSRGNPIADIFKDIGTPFSYASASIFTAVADVTGQAKERNLPSGDFFHQVSAEVSAHPEIAETQGLQLGVFGLGLAVPANPFISIPTWGGIQAGLGFVTGGNAVFGLGAPSQTPVGIVENFAFGAGIAAGIYGATRIGSALNAPSESNPFRLNPNDVTQPSRFTQEVSAEPPPGFTGNLRIAGMDYEIRPPPPNFASELKISPSEEPIYPQNPPSSFFKGLSLGLSKEPPAGFTAGLRLPPEEVYLSKPLSLEPPPGFAGSLKLNPDIEIAPRTEADIFSETGQYKSFEETPPEGTMVQSGKQTLALKLNEEELSTVLKEEGETVAPSELSAYEVAGGTLQLGQARLKAYELGTVDAEVLVLRNEKLAGLNAATLEESTLLSRQQQGLGLTSLLAVSEAIASACDAGSSPEGSRLGSPYRGPDPDSGKGASSGVARGRGTRPLGERSPRSDPSEQERILACDQLQPEHAGKGERKAQVQVRRAGVPSGREPPESRPSQGEARLL